MGSDLLPAWLDGRQLWMVPAHPFEGARPSPMAAAHATHSVLVVACNKCGRRGRYAVARLIEQRGRDAKGGFARRDYGRLSEKAGWQHE